MPSLRFDRPLGQFEKYLVTLENLSMIGSCFASCQYTSKTHSPEEGLDAITDACRVIIKKVAAFSTIVTIDPTRKEPLAYAQIHSPVPEPPITVHQNIDNDPLSLSYCSFLNKLAETPFNLADSTTPLWRVHVLMNQDSNHFDARVVVIFAHALMDGKSGPQWHEMLSAVLCRKTLLEMQDTELPKMPPPSEMIWNLEVSRMKQLRWIIKDRLVNTVNRFFGRQSNPFLRAKGIKLYPMNLKGLRLSASDLNGIVTEARSHQVTVNTIMAVSASYALGIARPGCCGESRAGNIKVGIPFTTQPGSPSVKDFDKGELYPYSVESLPSQDPLDQFVYLAVGSIDVGVEVRDESLFWEQCDSVRKPFRSSHTLAESFKRSFYNLATCPKYFPTQELTALDSAHRFGSCQLTGLEKHLFTRYTRPRLDRKLWLTNTGVANLSSNEIWTVKDIFRGMTADSTQAIYIGITSSDTMGIHIVYDPGRICEQEVDRFIANWHKILKNVAKGLVGETASMLDLMKDN